MASLKKTYHKAKSKWAVDRIKAVFLIGRGLTVEPNMFTLRMDENTIQGNSQKWKGCGMDGLMKRSYSEHEAFLT